MTTPEEAVREEVASDGGSLRWRMPEGWDGDPLESAECRVSSSPTWVPTYGEDGVAVTPDRIRAWADMIGLLTAERARLAALVTALRFDLRGADDGDGHFDEWEEMHPKGRYLDADAVLALLREAP